MKLVSEEIGYSRASIYAWRRKYIQKGTLALMNEKDIPRKELTAGNLSSIKELEQLKEQLQDMQMEIDILKETINVLKKDPGVNQTSLKNREKAVIVDALKSKYSLPVLLKQLDFSKSSYYYQRTVNRKGDKYSDIRKRITELFHKNRLCQDFFANSFAV